MLHLGFTDARQTARGADGGLDAVSSRAAAQVKHHSAPIGRPPLQNLVGAATRHEFRLFYATSGYTSSAMAYADAENVHLFRISDVDTVTPQNAAARALSATAQARLSNRGEQRRLANERRVEGDYDRAARDAAAQADVLRRAITLRLRHRSHRERQKAERGLLELATIVDDMQTSRTGGSNLRDRSAALTKAVKQLRRLARTYS